MIMLKDSVFEPSSPLCHSTELATIIEQRAPEKPVFFVYSDGGPDHRVTYLSVKLALICLSVKLDLTICVLHGQHHITHIETQWNR